MNEKTNEIRDKIVYGVHLAVKRLIEAKSKIDGELVYSKDGKVVRIKARDLQ